MFIKHPTTTLNYKLLSHYYVGMYCNSLFSFVNFFISFRLPAVSNFSLMAIELILYILCAINSTIVYFLSLWSISFPLLDCLLIFYWQVYGIPI